MSYTGAANQVLNTHVAQGVPYTGAANQVLNTHVAQGVSYTGAANQVLNTHTVHRVYNKQAQLIRFCIHTRSTGCTIYRRS